MLSVLKLLALGLVSAVATILGFVGYRLLKLKEFCSIIVIHVPM
jgi:hypothetical protein